MYSTAEYHVKIKETLEDLNAAKMIKKTHKPRKKKIKTIKDVMGSLNDLLVKELGIDLKVSKKLGMATRGNWIWEEVWKTVGMTVWELIRNEYPNKTKEDLREIAHNHVFNKKQLLILKKMVDKRIFETINLFECVEEPLQIESALKDEELSLYKQLTYFLERDSLPFREFAAFFNAVNNR